MAIKSILRQVDLAADVISIFLALTNGQFGHGAAENASETVKKWYGIFGKEEGGRKIAKGYGKKK